MTGRRAIAAAGALLMLGGAGFVPVGTTDSSFTDSTSSSASLSAAADWTAPSVGATAIAKSAGGDSGFIRPGGTYHVYANATDAGGLASVTADVRSLTSGQSQAPLVAGTYSVGGVTYGWRTAALTAGSGLSEGPVSFAVTASDNARNTASGSGTVQVDATAPTAADVQAQNVSGGTAGRPEAGDTLTLAYSEPIEPVSVAGGWDGNSIPVQVALFDGGKDSDYLRFYDQAGTTSNPMQLPLGQVDLGRKDYLGSGSHVVIGQTGVGTPSTMVRSGSALVMTLGTPNGSLGTAGNAGSMSWTPSGGATDRAGNGASTTSRTESGAVDRDF